MLDQKAYFSSSFKPGLGFASLLKKEQLGKTNPKRSQDVVEMKDFPKFLRVFKAKIYQQIFTLISYGSVFSASDT